MYLAKCALIVLALGLFNRYTYFFVFYILLIIDGIAYIPFDLMTSFSLKWNLTLPHVHGSENANEH